MCLCPGELLADGILRVWFGAGGGSLDWRRGGAGAARRVRGPLVLRGSRRVPGAAERASWPGSDRSGGAYAVEGGGEELVR